MKNYIGFVNDHSGSMASLAKAAAKDYNSQITAIKDAASREMLDTIVSVVGVGVPTGYSVTRQVTISNPHVLKPIDNWSVSGGTPLYDGIGNMIELLESLPDYQDPEVSFLVMITTDGEEAHSQTKWKDKTYLASRIRQLQLSGRWTFVFRVPKNARRYVETLGVPAGNIVEWDTTTKGMEQATQVSTQAMDQYFKTRSTGARGTNSFYSNAANINLAALEPLNPKRYSLYVVPNVDADDGIWIRDFILRHRMEYLKGAAFYQLVKTESKISHTKLILIQERTTGKVFYGPDARQMIGLPTDRNARLHPGDHANYNIFIQSESINRKLPKGTGVIYMPELGKQFTKEEIELYTQPAQPKRVPTVPVAATLPAVKNTSGKPVKSTMPVQKKGPTYFATRGDARRSGKPYVDNGQGAPKGQRWQQV